MVFLGSERNFRIIIYKGIYIYFKSQFMKSSYNHMISIITYIS